MPIIVADAAATGVDAVIESAGKVVEFSGTMLTTMLGNPIYAFLFAAGFVSIGLGIVRRLKRTASH